MNESILKTFDALQIAEFDDDMVGIGMNLINFMAEVRKLVDTDKIPEHEVPTNFHKLHNPPMDIYTHQKVAIANNGVKMISKTKNKPLRC
jgi:hypothetical protein